MWSSLIRGKLRFYRVTKAGIKAAPSGHPASVLWSTEEEHYFSRSQKFSNNFSNNSRHTSVRRSRPRQSLKFLSMRRIRHVVLPVRSWYYIGLLIVSLACLTLGLVSRDREGHAGSLAGPELIHRAPHEADSCPNLNPFTKTPSTSVPEETPKQVNEIKVSESRVSPTSRRTVPSRSMSLDRSLRLSSRETRQLFGNRDSLETERISRSKIRLSANRNRESQSRLIAQSRDVRSSYDPAIRYSRSRDLSSRITDRRSVENRLLNSERRSADRITPRLDNRRLQTAERRKPNEILQNWLDRSINRRVSSKDAQGRADNRRDHRSLPIERRILSDVNRQESRAADRREYQDSARSRAGRRSEMRDHRSRFVEQRAIERREAAERASRRRILPNHSARISREDLNRNSNLGRQIREQSRENRRAPLVHVANRERTSPPAAKNLAVESNDRRRPLSRSVERLGVNEQTLRRKARSADIERSIERRSSERFLVRFVERRETRHAERRKLESRLADRRSLDRATQVLPENLRGIIPTRENTESALSRVRIPRLYEENANRERRARFSRSVDRNSVEQRSRSSREPERRDLTLRSRETEQRMSGRVPERRVFDRQRVVPTRLELRSERRIINSRSREGSWNRRLDSRVLREKTPGIRLARDSRYTPERRIDESSRSRERLGMEDRRLERSLELRLTRGRAFQRRSAFESQRSFERRSREGSSTANRRLERSFESFRDRMSERRSAPDSRGSTDRRTDESSKLHESRIQSRRLERNSELRTSIEMRRMERSVNSRALLASRISRLSDKRSDARNLRDTRAERNMEVRKIVPKAIQDYGGFHEYPVTYDFLRQALLVGLCTVYGLSLYSKKSFIGNNIMQQAQRFLVW